MTSVRKTLKFLALAGLVLGAALSFALSRVLASLLFGAGKADGAIFAGRSALRKSQ